MIRLMICLARKPEMELTEFEDHLHNVHLPLVRKLPGLEEVRVYKVLTGPDGVAPHWDVVAEDDFDSVEAIGAALQSPEGHAVNADAATFLDLAKLQFLVLEERRA